MTHGPALARVLALATCLLVLLGCQTSPSGPTTPPVATPIPLAASPTAPTSSKSTPSVLASPTNAEMPSSTPVPSNVAATFTSAVASPSAAVPSATPEPTVPAVQSTPAATPVAQSEFPAPPARDLIALQQRLRSTNANGAAASPTPVKGADYPVGTDQPFWIANELTKAYFQITARVTVKTDHAYWYVQDGADIPVADVQTAASYFEAQTYSTEHRLFGSEWSPGIDGDVHITVMLGHIPGVGGYFSSADEYPRAVNPYSNQREMIYINLDAVRPGTAGFNATVAHEFQHMIQFNVHRNQNSWVNEGAAELAAQAVTGGTSGSLQSFEQRPETQLNAWASDPLQSVPHYGAAYLFERYVSEQFGGFSAIGKVVAEPGRSIAAFSDFFRTLNPAKTFDQVFADWVAANELDDPSLAQGQYGYKSLALHPTLRPGPSVGQTIRGAANQFGATYYQISTTAPATLTFSGAPTVQTIGAQPHDATEEWWSNRGDGIDSRLTRSVDLSSVKAASLHFWIWYDIEANYDYGYVEASTDGGKTWTTLATKDTTATNPNGESFGNAFTGESGGSTPTWVPETIDLKPYVGQHVLIRFEYITDDSYNADGFALDNVEIPEIGWHDTASTDSGWTTEGFTRISNQEPESYLVEILNPHASPVVRQVAIDSSGRGTLTLSPNESGVVAVSGLAARTTHQSDYQLSLGPG